MKSVRLQKGASYILGFRPDKVVEVHRFGPSKDLVAVYSVKDGECSCKSFLYRSSCKHLTMVTTKMELYGHPLRLSDARKLAHDISELWKSKGREDVRLEDYVRDTRGLVKKVELVTAKRESDNYEAVVGLHKGLLPFRVSFV